MRLRDAQLEREQSCSARLLSTEAWPCGDAPSARPISATARRSWEFSRRQQPHMWVADVEHPWQTVFPDRPAFVAMVSLHDRLKRDRRCSEPEAGCSCVSRCAGFGWRQRKTPEGAFAIGVCGSAAVYVLSYFVVGVASDFRYGLLGRCLPASPVASSPPRPLED